MHRSATVLLLGLAALSLTASPAAAQRQRLSMDPGWRFTPRRPCRRRAARLRRPGWRRLDLPHDWSIEGTPRPGRPGGGGMGYFPAGIGWYRKAFRAARRRPGPGGLARVRRHLHEQRRLDQRRPAGPAALRLHRLRLRRQQTSRARRQRGRRSRRQLAAAQLPVVHGQRHLPPRLADYRRSASRGPLGDLPDDPRRGLHGAPTSWPAPAWRTTAPCRAEECSAPSCSTAPAGRSRAWRHPSRWRPGQHVELEQRLRIAAPRLWSVETPYLYSSARR